jgi:hypothetical protein
MFVTWWTTEWISNGSVFKSVNATVDGFVSDERKGLIRGGRGARSAGVNRCISVAAGPIAELGRKDTRSS